MRLPEPRRASLVGAAVALQWLTMAWIGVRADDVSIGGRELLYLAFLVPIALASAFALAESVGGLALGAWTLGVWVVWPWLAPLLTLASYDDTMRTDVLPLLVGLTVDPAYVEGVALLAALSLCFGRTRRNRALVAAGSLVLAALIAIWLTRLPLPELSRDAFDAAMAGLREYFWSQRLLQWAPLAGIVAVARRSVPLAAALAVWLLGCLVLRWAHPGGGFEDGEIFRELLPALPAYVLLVSALPLLVPTLAARLGSLARPAPVS